MIPISDIATSKNSARISAWG